MKLHLAEVQKIKKRREELGITQSHIAKVFGKTKAWWSKKEMESKEGIDPEIEVNSNQLIELNGLLDLRNFESFSFDSDPMTFDESFIIKSAFQEAKDRNFLLTKSTLLYIIKASEDELFPLKSIIFHFISSIFSYKEHSSLVLTTKIRDSLTRAIQLKFPDDKSIDSFCKLHWDKAVDFYKKPNGKSDEYQLIYLQIEKAISSASDALMEDFTCVLKSTLKSTMKDHFFGYIQQKNQTKEKTSRSNSSQLFSVPPCQ